jgi:L-ascorbate metabolism protein UlaG (beta-lactamase superfamily)
MLNGPSRRPGRSRSLAAGFALAAALLLCTPWAVAGEVKLDYIAHASFLVESPGGTRVVLDPYNSFLWIGIQFPQALQADAAVVSHPHFDHDATYYLDSGTPAFREPGEYRIGDVRILGIASEHAGAQRFRERGLVPHNTFWVLEIGGLRIAHTGDNGPLSNADVAALGTIDVFLTHYRLLDDVATKVKPRIIVPMHYRMASLSELPEALSELEPLLEGREGVVRVGGSRTVLDPQQLPDGLEYRVFQPSAGVKPWAPEVHQAWKLSSEARQLLESGAEADSGKALRQLQEATTLVPASIAFHLEYGTALKAAGRTDEAMRAFEQGLKQAPRDDWERTLQVRGELAQLYDAAGRKDLAEEQYRAILPHAHTYLGSLHDSAVRYLEIAENIRQERLKDYSFNATRIPVGLRFHYRKSNIDGTHASNVAVYVAATRRLESLQWPDGGVDATLVTASMDWRRYSVRSFEVWTHTVGAEPRRQAELNAVPGTRRFRYRFGDREGEAEVSSLPWHSYDFYFASLAMSMRFLDNPQGEFDFLLAGAIRAPEGLVFGQAGEVHVNYEVQEDHNGVPCWKYKVDGPGLKNQGGWLWLDRFSRHLVDMEIQLPDESGYTSNKLLLLSAEPMTAEEWEAFKNGGWASGQTGQ